MRSEQEMLELILSVAQNDERIRAVCLNGSRVNPNVTPDCMQDYDVVYFVTELDSFLKTPSWVDVFGERTILQMPEDATWFEPLSGGKRFVYLMQFEDGNRIDLSLLIPEGQAEYLKEDTLTKVLLDKDNMIPTLPEASDETHRGKIPTENQFLACCNEFWWVSPYVAKGLWRDEILFALSSMEIVREQLFRLLEWTVAIDFGESVSIGKHGKFLRRYLKSEIWKRYLTSYPRAETEEIWQALFAMGDLFRELAQALASTCGYSYPAQDDTRVSNYLKRIYRGEIPRK